MLPISRLYLAVLLKSRIDLAILSISRLSLAVLSISRLGLAVLLKSRLILTVLPISRLGLAVLLTLTHVALLGVLLHVASLHSMALEYVSGEGLISEPFY